MGVGTDLIAMQDLGLEISRQQGMLSSMPELKEIAKKRATLAKLRAEHVMRRIIAFERAHGGKSNEGRQIFSSG